MRSGKVAGAALDVFSAEPYEGELLALENVVVTPHLAASTDEAQDRAGLIVAEQVVAALDERPRHERGQHPGRRRGRSRGARPVYPAGGGEAGTTRDRSAGGHSAGSRSYNGAIAAHDTRLLTVAALNGAFQGRVEQAVNYVNAPVIAAERGIEVTEERSSRARDWLSLVTVAVDDVEVSGTTIGPEHRHFLARCARVCDRPPALAADGLLPLRRHPGRDRPGRDDVRRGARQHRQHGRPRTKEGGKALMALSIDSEPPAALVERIRGEGFDDAQFIDLG